jgi:hypothetical protein
MATWTRGYDPPESVKRDSQEWDEHWNAIGYEPPLNQPAWVGLLAERPDLSPGQPHPVVLGAYVEDFGPERNGTAAAWEVAVRYVRGRETTQQDVPPTQRPAVIEVQPESIEVPTFRWQNGDPIINKAGDLIAGVTRTENHWVFAVQKNVVSVPAWALTYADAVNSDPVSIKGLTVAPHYLLLKDLRIGNETTETVNALPYTFFPVSFSLVYNPRKWITKVYNRGLYEINDDGDKVRITDDEGEPVDEPQFLDDNGKRLPYPVNPSSIVVIEDWLHELKPFSALPLT